MKIPGRKLSAENVPMDIVIMVGKLVQRLFGVGMVRINVLSLKRQTVGFLVKIKEKNGPVFQQKYGMKREHFSPAPTFG